MSIHEFLLFYEAIELMNLKREYELSIAGSVTQKFHFPCRKDGSLHRTHGAGTTPLHLADS